jgi:hypothetical protein
MKAALVVTALAFGLTAAAAPETSQPSMTSNAAIAHRCSTLLFGAGSDPGFEGSHVYPEASLAMKNVGLPPARCVDGAGHNSCTATVVPVVPAHPPERALWFPGPWLPAECIKCADKDRPDPHKLIDCRVPGAVATPDPTMMPAEVPHGIPA